MVGQTALGDPLALSKQIGVPGASTTSSPSATCATRRAMRKSRSSRRCFQVFPREPADLPGAGDRQRTGRRRGAEAHRARPDARTLRQIEKLSNFDTDHSRPITCTASDHQCDKTPAWVVLKERQPRGGSAPRRSQVGLVDAPVGPCCERPDVGCALCAGRRRAGHGLQGHRRDQHRARRAVHVLRLHRLCRARAARPAVRRGVPAGRGAGGFALGALVYQGAFKSLMKSSLANVLIAAIARVLHPEGHRAHLVGRHRRLHSVPAAVLDRPAAGRLGHDPAAAARGRRRRDRVDGGASPVLQGDARRQDGCRRRPTT